MSGNNVLFYNGQVSFAKEPYFNLLGPIFQSPFLKKSHVLLIGWQQRVESLIDYVSFAKEPYFWWALLQADPRLFSHTNTQTDTRTHLHIHTHTHAHTHTHTHTYTRSVAHSYIQNHTEMCFVPQRLLVRTVKLGNFRSGSSLFGIPG